LLERRFGGDPEQMQAVVDYLYPVRDKVLDNAHLQEGEVLLDVGAGDGLIAFGALARSETGRVIFFDVSQDLLAHAEALARKIEVAHRCQFLRAAAEDLAGLENGSVDVVTTRSVLIYVAAKQPAFDAFHRALAPGGRLSIFEPINRFNHPEPAYLFGGYNVLPVQALADRVKAIYEQRQPEETDTMLDFDERDLGHMAERAGFREINMELHVEIQPQVDPVSWETWLNAAPNPHAPTGAEAIHEALKPEEAERFAAHLRPLVETGRGTARRAVAYLWAVKDARGR
jgi:ubiquinone/menaquinone biosynthesis C-methylase UbiE